MTGLAAATTQLPFADASRAAADTATVPAADPLAKKETFLQLLVAQIKHQNPLNPADGVEFLAQLAQFTQLEQLLAMRQELASIREQLAAASESGGADTPPQTAPAADAKNS